MSAAAPAGMAPFQPAASPSPACTAAVNARWLMPMSADSALSYWANAQSDWPGRLPVSNSAAARGLVTASARNRTSSCSYTW